MNTTMVETPMSDAPVDYPAAHSMDTDWFAVDELGDFGLLDSGPDGIVPAYPGHTGPLHKEDLGSPLHVPRSSFERDELSEMAPPAGVEFDMTGLMDLAGAPEELTDRWSPRCPTLILFKDSASVPAELQKQYLMTTELGPVILPAIYERQTGIRISPTIYNGWVREERLKAVWDDWWNDVIGLKGDASEAEAVDGVGLHYFSAGDHGHTPPYKHFRSSILRFTNFAGYLDPALAPNAVRIKDFAFCDRDPFQPADHFAAWFPLGQSTYSSTSGQALLPRAGSDWSEKDAPDWGTQDIILIDSKGRLAIFSFFQDYFEEGPLRPLVPPGASTFSINFGRTLPQDAFEELTPDLEGIQFEPFSESRPRRMLLRLQSGAGPLVFARDQLASICRADGYELCNILESRLYETVKSDEHTYSLRLTIPPELIVEVATGGWMRHWLEYPYGAFTPSRLGFYHYAIVWHHAAPLIRIAEPRHPLTIEQLPAKLRELTMPLAAPGMDFERDRLVQLMEHFECETNAPFWIDSKVERVVPVPGMKADMRRGREDRLLRQFRKHRDFIDSLRRDERE